MKQELEGQTRAQMMGDFMNICIGLQVMIVSSANKPFFIGKILPKSEIKLNFLKMK
jgi:hypothetical protein